MPLYFRFNILFVLLYALSACFVGCNGDHKQHKTNNNQIAGKITVTDLFLSYTDSVAKIPLNRFNESNIISLNKSFANKLPLSIYKGEQNKNAQNIIVQSYQNNNASHIGAGAILLLPKFISDSLRVGDFTRHFGNIKKEKPTIGVTEQPLPVEINLNAYTSIKLTFNNNEKLELAQVTMVEVLKYR
ncbi:hypothetical protein ASE74_06745 [Pedobacter sp. Leaf216]|uniref:hypothetical protein n=1 Tax=Pedobacter sp. Leaf216 TaxID=1735684 RepID=UPI0006FA8E10|nr:hypothetical protein [Pedobacter sp. Leaf216]KQM67159.1 hypothetical protein ASE74_06745 [Pedobacter sp. Leaf216]